MTTPNSELAVVQRDDALAIAPEDLDLVRRTIMPPDSTPQEFEMFVSVCRATRLHPMARQIYPLKIQGRMSIHIGIDGLRKIATLSGNYVGQEGPEWCGPDGVWKSVWLEDSPPAAARVGVYRRGERPTWGIATWKEFSKPTKNSKGKPTMWGEMPAHMLAKCAEGQALRKAFSNEIPSVNVPIEVDAEESYQPRVVNDRPPKEGTFRERLGLTQGPDDTEDSGLAPLKEEETAFEEPPEEEEAIPNGWIENEISRLQAVLQSRGADDWSLLDAYIQNAGLGSRASKRSITAFLEQKFYELDDHDVAAWLERELA